MLWMPPPPPDQKDFLYREGRRHDGDGSDPLPPAAPTMSPPLDPLPPAAPTPSPPLHDSRPSSHWTPSSASSGQCQSDT
ncbi:hypothetical protein GUJ93_ZPchr0001g30499 [Zizania palustris]|uniref:Uncharacterized protein n=1 Tax=Zizania palustris TaxID=103762 RepID=A0A8J5RSZ4_ZIZPA|nr:hypothetical protein GUJ93_ZPchr0001g30499 [Zizania palustris]